MIRYAKKIMHSLSNCHLFPNFRITRYVHTGGPSTSKRSHYEVLGVKPTATTQEIRDAFVKLSKLYHPDVNKDDKQAHEQFVEINEAYSVLSKNESRREYDAKLRQGWSQGQQEPSPYSDPTRERYRQYYDELTRMRRPPPGFSKYGGPPPEDPLRDFWRDFNKAFEEEQQRQRQWPRPGQGIRMDQAANRAFFRFIVALVWLSILVHFLRYMFTRERPMHPDDYGPFDFERFRRDAVIIDRPAPDDRKPKVSSPYSPGPDDRYVET